MTDAMTLEVFKSSISLLQAIIPSIVAAVIGNRVLKVKSLITQFDIALNDLAFMYDVEEFYINSNKEKNAIGKNLVRKKIKNDTNRSLSSKFSRSQIDIKTASLQRRLK